MMKTIFIKILLLAPILLLARPQDFSEAKREMIKIYKNLGEQHWQEFYCNAPFKITKKNKLLVIPSEAFTPRKTKKEKSSGSRRDRSKFIEWEHIVPMSIAYHHFPCWREGGRKNCQKNDENFNKLEADMFNLMPSIGSINGDRSNYHYAQAPKNFSFNQYGNCKVFTDFKGKRFYPADYSKGYIARTYLYMAKQYNIKLSKQEKNLMLAWNKQYPMDKKEKYFRKVVSKIMGVDFFKVIRSEI